MIFKLDKVPNKSFGFQLRDDRFGPVREGMLSLLRLAIAEKLMVKVDYDEFVQPPNQNCIAKIVALVRSQSAPPTRATR